MLPTLMSELMNMGRGHRTGSWKEGIEQEKVWKCDDQRKGGRIEFEEDLKHEQHVEQLVRQAGELGIDAK